METGYNNWITKDKYASLPSLYVQNIFNWYNSIVLKKKKEEDYVGMCTDLISAKYKNHNWVLFSLKDILRCLIFKIVTVI